MVRGEKATQDVYLVIHLEVCVRLQLLTYQELPA